jgi:hypothetical protein
MLAVQANAAALASKVTLLEADAAMLRRAVEDAEAALVRKQREAAAAATLAESEALAAADLHTQQITEITRGCERLGNEVRSLRG